MLPMDVDQFVPRVSKRAKTAEVPKMPTAYSPSWHRPSIHKFGEESPQFVHSDHGYSTLSTVSNPTTPLAFNQTQQPRVQQQQRQQSAGQQSSERIFAVQSQREYYVGYRGMNSLLGSLHLSRRRQKASEAGVYQQSAQHSESCISHHHVQSEGLQEPEMRLRRSKSSQKNVLSLRIDSNLY